MPFGEAWEYRSCLEHVSAMLNISFIHDLPSVHPFPMWKVLAPVK